MGCNPGIGDVPVVELIVRHLLPLAADGLADPRVAPDLIDRYMEILRARAQTEQNDASWQIKTLRMFEAGGLDRPAALAEMTRQYSAQHAYQRAGPHLAGGGRGG